MDFSKFRKCICKSLKPHKLGLSKLMELKIFFGKCMTVHINNKVSIPLDAFFYALKYNNRFYCKLKFKHFLNP